MVGTFHASGDLGWMKIATPVWGFLVDRIDRRIAVSEMARETAKQLAARRLRDRPERRAHPRRRRSRRAASTASSSRAGTRARKGLQVLLEAWPEIRRRTGATLRIIGADPLRVRLLMTRLRVPDDGIEVLGFLDAGALHRGAARREGARRAVARRRELRHGADARARVRDAGRRVRHPRLPRRDDARDLRRRSPPATARRSSRRSTRCSPTSRAAARWAPPGARSRRSATRGTRSRGG